MIQTPFSPKLGKSRGVTYRVGRLEVRVFVKRGSAEAALENFNQVEDEAGADFDEGRVLFNYLHKSQKTHVRELSSQYQHIISDRNVSYNDFLFLVHS